MAYIRYKEVTKHFNFSKAVGEAQLPRYVRQYVLEDETIFAAYKTSRDHGIFTDKKMVLFDNFKMFGPSKEIFTIPYSSISVISVAFGSSTSELNLSLDCGFPLKLRFVNMKAEDKVRLRLLYTCINRVINNQKPREEDVKRLITNDVSFK